MTYIVITPDGQLQQHADPVTRDVIFAAVGGWFDLVRLRRGPRMFAFVNDAGHLVGLPRNPVGACVVAYLGATPSPYCGPIVITGWQEPHPVSELRDLTDRGVSEVVAAHTLVTAVLAGHTPPAFEHDPGKAQAMREYARYVENGPAPTLTIVGF